MEYGIVKAKKEAYLKKEEITITDLKEFEWLFGDWPCWRIEPDGPGVRVDLYTGSDKAPEELYKRIYFDAKSKPVRIEVCRSYSINELKAQIRKDENLDEYNDIYGYK